MCDRVRYRLPFSPSTAHAARARLSWFLSERRVDQVVIDDALVVVSELVSNAVRHGRPDPDGTVGVEWYLCDGLHLFVHDGGRNGTSLRPRPVDVDALGGRGLTIIEALAAEWAVEAGPGTTVHACIPL